MNSAESGAGAPDRASLSTSPVYPKPLRAITDFQRSARTEDPSPSSTPSNSDSPRPEAIDASLGLTFWDHISELRKRLLLSFVGIVIGAIAAYASWEKLWTAMAYPLTRQHLKVDFIATSPLESFVTSLKLSMLAGTVMAFPWVMWQAWRFLAPALYKREKQLFVGAFFGSVLMFIIGAVFSYAVVLPAGLHFLASYTSGSVTQSWKQADYAAFISQFMLAFGIIFEMPVVAFILAKLGLVTARGMWGFFRYAILLIFVVAALLTPGPDPISQVLLALPLCVLYILSIAIAAWFQPKEEKENKAA